MSAPIFLFPGQGSQAIGMGREFYESVPAVKDIFEEASEISGIDIAKLCFSGPLDKLTETKNLQPAMTAVTLSCLYALSEYDVIPSFVMGHSLGEYAALVAANVISTTDCLRLVTERGRLMQEQAEAHPGVMAAVMRLDAPDIEALVAEVAKEEPMVVANYNSPQQIVVSGSERGLEKLTELAKEKRGRCKALPVSGAWHSPLMKGAEEAFNALIDEVEFEDAKVPIILNVTGKPAEDGQFIKEQMKLQMCTGVRWYQGIIEAWKQDTRLFVELGPKGVLTRMLRYIVPDSASSRTFIVESPQTLNNYFSEDDL